MKKLFLAGLLALPAVLAATPLALAQGPGVIPPPGCGACGGVPGQYPTPGCPCKFAGCGGTCMNWFGRIHFHGPLFNYGPYCGYYPFEPYGPWTSSLQYNPPPAPCHNCGAHDKAWKHYALNTLTNVLHRINPLGHKCGKGHWSDCSGCGGVAAGPGAAAVTVPALPATTVAAGDR